jgi:hypothetical protein
MIKSFLFFFFVLIFNFLYTGIGIPEVPIDINIQTNPEIIQVGVKNAGQFAKL